MAVEGLRPSPHGGTKAEHVRKMLEQDITCQGHPLSDLLPLARPHLPNFPEPPKQYHQLEANPLTQESVGDLLYLSHHSCQIALCNHFQLTSLLPMIPGAVVMLSTFFYLRPFIVF